MTVPTAVTFEQGYARLQEISERVTSEQVPVAEMCDLFAEGKGLQTALTTYLDEQKGRVEAIERGDGVRPFRIVAPTTPQSDPFSTARAEPSPITASALGSGAADDDIPF